MRTLEWDNMGVKIDGRQIHHLRFADDIVLITPDISQAERMLVDFDKACGKIGLRLNLKKTIFMKDGLVSFAPFTLNGTNISECFSYVLVVVIVVVVVVSVVLARRWLTFRRFRFPQSRNVKSATELYILCFVVVNIAGNCDYDGDEHDADDDGGLNKLDVDLPPLESPLDAERAKSLK
uniref:Reverse transcriptase domain-containing protein n=1 Tax=Angiostrongylus cantonensis TaxID=6313 RepID=A0A0K0D9Z3_ANGCA